MVKGPQWPEPAEIQLVEHLDNDAHIVRATVINKSHIDQGIPLEEFQKISILLAEVLSQGDPAKVFLALETMGKLLFLPSHVKTIPFNLGTSSPKGENSIRAF